MTPLSPSAIRSTATGCGGASDFPHGGWPSRPQLGGHSCTGRGLSPTRLPAVSPGNHPSLGRSGSAEAGLPGWASAARLGLFDDSPWERRP